MRELIDINTVAQMAGGLTPQHVREKLIKRPDFPRAFRIGGRIMFDRPEVVEWIEMQRVRIDGRTQKSRNKASRASN
ncbi:helix-turn-helix domain-containing protein [Alcaligenaceae bacterium]|nr:helix-turn-helix domain-containing protein [Alcaligenaceae bacterium]